MNDEGTASAADAQDETPANGGETQSAQAGDQTATPAEVVASSEVDEGEATNGEAEGGEAES